MSTFKIGDVVSLKSGHKDRKYFPGSYTITDTDVVRNHDGDFVDCICWLGPGDEMMYEGAELELVE